MSSTIANVDFIPIASLSAFHIPQVGLVEITIQGYCDGSGKPDDPATRYLTLCGLIAEPKEWAPFELEWSRTLADHGIRGWHSKDAYAGVGDFVGRTLDDIKVIRNDLYKRCFEAIAYENGFVHASCTVVLEDWRRAATDMPAVADTPPSALCAYWIANAALGRLPKDENDPLGKRGMAQLFFDRNEPFLHHIQKEWERRKDKRWSDIASRIVRCFPVSSSVLGIQAADFLAWHRNRALTTDYNVADTMSKFAVPIHFMLWDYGKLIEAYTELASGDVGR